jgi:hypothetical protein
MEDVNARGRRASYVRDSLKSSVVPDFDGVVPAMPCIAENRLVPVIST